MAIVASYDKVEIDQALLMEALKGGAMGAGVVFATDFLLSKFLKHGKIRAIACAVAPLALAMWLKEKNPELATGMAIGGAGAGIYKVIQAFLYERMHIPFTGMDEYGIIEEVPVEEYPEVMATEQEAVVPQAGYGKIVEVPEEEELVEVSETQPTYGTSLV